jgi:hypothetical protein
MGAEAGSRPAVGPLFEMFKKMPAQLILLNVGCLPRLQRLATAQLQIRRRRLRYSDFSSPSLPSPLSRSSSAASKSVLPPPSVRASPAT